MKRKRFRKTSYRVCDLNDDSFKNSGKLTLIFPLSIAMMQRFIKKKKKKLYRLETLFKHIYFKNNCVQIVQYPSTLYIVVQKEGVDPLLAQPIRRYCKIIKTVYVLRSINAIAKMLFLDFVC